VGHRRLSAGGGVEASVRPGGVFSRFRRGTDPAPRSSSSRTHPTVVIVAATPTSLIQPSSAQYWGPLHQPCHLTVATIDLPYASNSLADFLSTAVAGLSYYVAG